ncbi:SpoIIE family protein phosphatase [Collinsella tanakaei]|uniref:SpoIIE family protein phosphatase n=1 Tax=Collinsella tanakaei TaxID=626935 RepID=UPI0025A34565|nr:SpoIIE family protein phosphatase [Collinsella tanakaei]MDM8300941.1 SpoIIE family protein phosphatase [Collinsella tanakaei]
MESKDKSAFGEVANLVELTSDAVALCERDGTVLHVNQQMLSLVEQARQRIVGQDIKDYLYSEAFERAPGGSFPFSLDGRASTCRLKLPEGSFIPVSVRASEVSARTFGPFSHGGKRVLMVVRSLEEQYAHDRQTQRLLKELQAVNRRLSGTLSVIMTAAGSKDLPSLLDAVLNKLVETLDADGSSIYFSESGGFKLRGISYGLTRDYVPEFIPFGAGVPTYVLREQRTCNLAIVPSSYGRGADSNVFYDIDTRESTRLRVENMPPYRTLIAVPVFFGTQVLGILELGWKRPRLPRALDARVLEVICDYLSIELVGLVSSLRSQRTEELTRSLNRTREFMFSQNMSRRAVWDGMTDEVHRVLQCRVCAILPDTQHHCYVLDFEGGSRVCLPGTIEEMFFSTTAPAARVDPLDRIPLVHDQSAWSCAPEDLRTVRLVRVDTTTWAGEWLASRGLPSQGVFFDLRETFADAGADDEGEAGEDAAEGGVPRMVLLLRDSTQEPIDNLEYDYLVRLAHDFEIMCQGMQKANSERRIAQTLQVGMRNSLGSVPGITTDSLYSSATQQAMVGGDFYTLIRLPDDRAVMVLGDVSGKGVEAASMSALVKTALTAYAWEGASPQHMVRSLNNMLMSFSRVETFATMFVAKIDLRSHVATYCSAGHPPTVLIHPAVPGSSDADAVGEMELLSVQSGVVGAFESMAYESGVFSFSAGDILFMYTDGAIEARDASGEFFGERRLFDLVLHESASGVHGLCASVLDQLDEFTSSTLDDDIALVALRFDA